MRKAEPEITGVRKASNGKITHIQLTFDWVVEHHVWVEVDEVESQWELPPKRNLNRVYAP